MAVIPDSSDTAGRKPERVFAIEFCFEDGKLSVCRVYSTLDYEAFQSAAIGEFGTPYAVNSEVILKNGDRGMNWILGNQFVLLIDVSGTVMLALMPLG